MKNMDRYLSGDYKKKNHSYHIEDSAFKWKNLFNILKKSQLQTETINSITDIGCGAGQMLIEAKKSKIFNKQCVLEGYDINSDAIKLAKKNSNGINFFNEDFINLYKKSDLIIASDVFEHIQDTYGFLEKLREKGKFFLFNIPLEISLISMIRKKNIFKKSYENVGHLHFYTIKTAILLLESNGFIILKQDLVNNRLKEFKDNKKISSLFINTLQYFFQFFSKRLSSSIFGGYSLVVLAKK